mgnify:FL=1
MVRLADVRLGDAGEQALIEFVGERDRVATKRSAAPMVVEDDEAAGEEEAATDEETAVDESAAGEETAQTEAESPEASAGEEPADDEKKAEE